MKVLIASDKFKGSLTADDACAAIQEGLLRGSTGSSLTIRTLPVADGGDGIARSLTRSQGGTWVTLRVRNALGTPTEAGYGLLDDGQTAVIEMAEASGLAQLGADEKDPLSASTFGTGELIRDAMARSVKQIILGIGGSATNDGGVGIAQALGWKFFDRAGDLIDDLPRRLPEVVRLAPPADDSLPPVTVACDVVNPLLGEDGCTRVYGPQKGIEAKDIPAHEARLAHLVHLMNSPDAASRPGAGAAGGLGFGALVFLKATLTPGFDLVAEILDLEAAVQESDWVITGEGSLDLQSLEGKAPFGVAQLAKKHGKPLTTFCGIRGGAGLEEFFGEIIEIRDPEAGLEENLRNGFQNLARAAARLTVPIRVNP